VDGAAWLAFHIVLEMFGVRAARSVAADRPDVVMMADRCVCVRARMCVSKYTIRVFCVRTYVCVYMCA